MGFHHRLSGNCTPVQLILYTVQYLVHLHCLLVNCVQLYIVHHIQYIVQHKHFTPFTLYTIYIVHYIHCTPYILYTVYKYTVRIAQCLMILQFFVCITAVNYTHHILHIHCKLYNVHFTLYTVPYLVKHSLNSTLLLLILEVVERNSQVFFFGSIHLCILQ